MQSYNQAIHYLSPHVSLKNTGSLRVTMVTCILFVCLEIVRENYATAISHLSNGLRLVEQYSKSRDVAGVEAYLDHGSDNLIRQMFLKLSLQVNMFGNTHPLAILTMDGLICDKPPSRFAYISEARQQLDRLLIQVFELNNISRNREPLYDTWSALVAHQTDLRIGLNSWLEVFNT